MRDTLAWSVFGSLPFVSSDVCAAHAIMSCILCAIKTHHRINGALSRLQTELTASHTTWIDRWQKKKPTTTTAESHRTTMTTQITQRVEHTNKQKIRHWTSEQAQRDERKKVHEKRAVVSENAERRVTMMQKCILNGSKECTVCSKISHAFLNLSGKSKRELLLHTATLIVAAPPVKPKKQKQSKNWMQQQQQQR